MKIGFLGTGNMAQAIIHGLVNTDFIDSKDIYCSARNQEKLLEFTNSVNATKANSNIDLVKEVDIVVLATHPQTFDKMIPEVADIIMERNLLVVSIAAGYQLEHLSEYFNDNTAIIRVMPSVNVKLNAGVAALCGNKNVTKDQMNTISKLFDSIGKSFEIEENLFATFSAVGCASPAYTFIFIDSLARAGVKNGLTKELANQIAAQAVLGSAKMVLEGVDTPWNLVETVSSPGGTTVAGVVALEDNAFVSTVIKGVQATIDKDKDLKE